MSKYYVDAIEQFLRTATAEQLMRLHDGLDDVGIEDRESLVRIKGLLRAMIEYERGREIELELESSLRETMD